MLFRSQYTGARSVLDSLIGTPWSWMLEAVALAAMLGACYRERRQEANTSGFAFMISLVLATTVLLVPISAPYNHVLLIPALLLLAKERRTIWQSNLVIRVLFLITAGLIFWPWVSSVVLAGLSFVLPAQTVEPTWAIPSWTLTQVPVGVAALMLVIRYQRTLAAPVVSGSPAEHGGRNAV